MLALPDEAGGIDGWIIDTPGIRSFGLAHVRPEDLIEAFPDLDEMTEDCPRGCTHGADEPECGLDEAVARGDADPERVESFRRLLVARSEPEYSSARQLAPEARAPESPVRNTQTSTATAPTTSSTWSAIATRAGPALARAPARRQRRGAAQLPGAERGRDEERQQHPAQDAAPVRWVRRARAATGGCAGSRASRPDWTAITPAPAAITAQRHERPAQPPAPARHHGVEDAGDGRQRREHDDDVDDERVQRQAVELHGIGIAAGRVRFGIACAHAARHVATSPTTSASPTCSPTTRTPSPRRASRRSTCT